MPNKPQNYGFDPTSIVIKKDHYVLGAQKLQGTILQPDGQWDDFIPKYEPQAEFYETCGCTVWGTINATEFLEKRLFGGDPDWSERFIYNLQKIRCPGGNPHDVAQCIHDYGLINQANLPVPPTYEEFVTPDPMSNEFIAKGQKWLDTRDFEHEWLFENEVTDDQRIGLIKNRLMYSPVAVSVTAWFEQNGVYVDLGQPNNHWCVIFGYTDQGFKVFDSYDHSVKILAYDHHISFAKWYLLKQATPKQSWIEKVLAFLHLC